MDSLAELRARVTSGYARLGLPSWPDPHPQRDPREEEYSRLTEPERYRIVHARARVWSEQLAERPGVRVEDLGPSRLDDEGHAGSFDRGVRLTSSRPGTPPLLLLERDVRISPQIEAVLAVLQISVVRPEVALEVQPDCGCDACDSGSADLLEAIDETIGRVLGGPTVVLRGKGWHAEWHPDGGSSGGTGRALNHAELMDQCRRLARGEDVRLPRGTEALVGRPWFD